MWPTETSSNESWHLLYMELASDECFQVNHEPKTRDAQALHHPSAYKNGLCMVNNWTYKFVKNEVYWAFIPYNGHIYSSTVPFGLLNIIYIKGYAFESINYTIFGWFN